MFIDDTIDTYNDYYKSIRNIPVLTRQEEIALFMRYEKKDQKARDLLIKHNLKLVASVVSNFKYCDIGRMDLIQQGNIELINAIDLFDYKLGNKFSTYATHRIFDKLLNYIKHYSKVIRIPSELYDLKKRIVNAELDLYQKLGRKPKINEIARYLDISEQSIISANTVFLNPISLYTSINNSDSSDEIKEKEMMYDCIEDKSYVLQDIVENSFGLCIGNKFFKDYKELFDILDFNDIDKKILILRYGFVNENTMTLEQIGKELNITTEAVRQREKKCLERLRNYFGIKKEDKKITDSFKLQLLEFYKNDNLQKFCVNKKNCYFSNGTCMNGWWARNINTILFSNDEICKNIAMQYKDYIDKGSKIKMLKK